VSERRTYEPRTFELRVMTLDEIEPLQSCSSSSASRPSLTQCVIEELLPEMAQAAPEGRLKGASLSRTPCARQSFCLTERFYTKTPAWAAGSRISKLSAGE
jgi:hypothetical protein